MAATRFVSLRRDAATTFVETGDRRRKKSSIIMLSSLFQELFVFLAVGVFEMAPFAEDQRTLVIGEDADAVTVVVLDGRAVKLELP